MNHATSNPINPPRIYADFNKTDGDANTNWLVLTCHGTFLDLERMNLKLTEGLRAVFYMDDGDELGNPNELEADGYVHFDAEKNHWTAVIDWKTLRHVSDKRRK